MIKTICYGKTTKWQNRREAIKFYFDCLNVSEGAERERYLRIYIQLQNGKNICSDEIDTKLGA